MENTMKMYIATVAATCLSIASVKADMIKPAGVYTVKPADVVRMAKPEFPQLPLRLHWEGFVLVRVQVGLDGKAKQALVAKSTNPMFNDAALESAMTAEYAPATMPQGPVASWVEIPFTFKFQR